MCNVRKILVVTLAFAIAAITSPVASALDPERQLNQLHHTAWTIRDGLPFAGVMAVTQTPDGFLWLASYVGGLHRFDGIKAEPIATQQLRDREITTLATDGEGDLWLGFLTPDIARFREGRLEFFEVPTTGMRGAILYIVPDPDGSIWVATRDQVHHFDGARWRVLDDPWPLTSTAFSDPGGVWALELARDGTLWSKNLIGLYFLRRGANAFEQAVGYAGGMFDFARDAQGRLWTSDFASRRFYSLPDVTPDKHLPPPRLGAAVPDSMVGILRADRDGTFWNANRVTGFLYRIPSLDAPGQPDRFTTRDGLTAEFPSGVFEDREGNMWIATNLGLDRFRNVAIANEPRVRIRPQALFMDATSDALYVYSGMRAPVPDPDGEAGGRLYRIGKREPPEIVDDDIGQVTGMSAAPDGSIVFSRDGALFRWRAGSVTRIALPPHLVGGHVVNLVATTDGLVVSFYQKGVHRLSAGRWEDITASSATAKFTASVSVDAQGAAWLFYWHDENVPIFRVGPQGTREFRSPIGIIHGTVSDRDGLILLGPNGLARFDGEKLQTISTTRAPILQLAYGIEQSEQGDVWIARADGIVRFDRDALMSAFARPDAPLGYQLFDVSDGFTGAIALESFNGYMAQGPDGRIWTFTKAGLSWIDPARPYRNTQPPPVVITSLMAQSQRHDMPQSLALPAGTSQVEIHYAAPSLSMPERIQFRYKLEDVDDDWVEAGGRRQAFYTSLPPGEHRFRVIAANNDGVWNTEGASLVFSIAPTFLQSVWFKLLLAIGIALLMWVTYRMLLKRQAAVLHKRFDIRIAERERIARELHDTLLQSVQGLILRFDSVASHMPSESALYASAQEAIRHAEVVVAEGRDRVRDLRTTTKADLGQSIVEASREIIHGDMPRFTLSVKGEQRVVHVVVGDEMLRVAGEAIRNVFQHARAKTLEVVLVYGEAELLMLIQDDGVGIPHAILTNAEKPGHYGLIGMRERARRIGGRLRIHSRDSGGTVVSLTVPAGAAYSDRRGFWNRLLRNRGEEQANHPAGS